jgi:phosphatidate cytidylyltransferase
MIPLFSADPELAWLFSGVATLLVVATSAGLILKVSLSGEAAQATMANVMVRIRAWWVLAAVFVAALATGDAGLIALFGLTSFLALREFITLAPTRPGDHRALCWIFLVIAPLQYWLVARGWYGLFSVLIPVYVFLFVPVQSALIGDPERFLERTADIQWGLTVCVFCLSHAPALLTLHIPGYEGENAKLLVFLVLVTQLSDVLQFVWGKTVGRRRIAPTISPNKTWGGFLGGVGSATLIGASLWWATPFTPWQAAGMSLVITLLGFAGGLTLSAIKRDRGVKDYGTLIEGHGGVLDRIDSLCFAAPVFFHLTRYFFT